MSDETNEQDAQKVASQMYAVGDNYQTGDLVNTSDVSESDLNEINELMMALVGLRRAEEKLSEASRKYMKLSSQDMRALHYLIAAKRSKTLITPSMIATHLNISAASTTKLLNKLEDAGHIIRSIHPVDRRALVIDVTPETQVSANSTVGRQQARRFHAAARLNSEERKTVTSFLKDMTAELLTASTLWDQPEETPN